METKQQPTPERASEIKEGFFLRRPIFSTVISLIITLVGAIAISVLPIEQYPNLTPPQVEVSATYTGASAEVIAETVASLLESHPWCPSSCKPSQRRLRLSLASSAASAPPL